MFIDFFLICDKEISYLLDIVVDLTLEQKSPTSPLQCFGISLIKEKLENQDSVWIRIYLFESGFPWYCIFKKDYRNKLYVEVCIRLQMPYTAMISYFCVHQNKLSSLFNFAKIRKKSVWIYWIKYTYKMLPLCV